MGWFESQIHERRANDDALLDRAMRDLSAAVTGKRPGTSADDGRTASDAVDAVLAYYGVRPTELPRGVTGLRDIVDYQLRPTGIRYRTVRLPKGWYKDAIGALLATTTDGVPVALVPQRGGYCFVDPATGSKVRVNERSAVRLSDEAYCFYRPLPLKELAVRDILVYMFRCLDAADYVLVALATLAATLLGMLLPAVNQVLFGPVVESGRAGLLLPIVALLLGATVSQALIGGVKSLVLSRIDTKLSVAVEAAAMMRVLSLPAAFFKQYASGDLASRLTSIRAIAAMIENIVLNTALTSVFSLAYIGQVFAIAPSLALPALLVILVNVAVGVATTLLQIRVSRKELEYSAELSGWQYSLIGGIQKIKLAGAERRAFATWAAIYQKLVRITYNGPLAVRLASTLQTAVSLVGTALIYLVAVDAGVTVSQYMAFSAAFGMVSGSFSALTGAAGSIAMIKPHLDMAAPILRTLPEVSERRQVLPRITGAFELDNVTFSYGGGQAPIIDGLSLKVRPGQYVAVVGRTGCGKSTLMRLLLGFETPQKGAVYYDGHDLASLDAASLRRNIGVVLQNGKLFQGDIFSNIVVSAPWLTLDDAWEAAEMAGIADDIRAMPMGMHTMISEGSGGVSGGQRQRLMIARAIAPKPKILMFDEATSALDNVTQRIVSDSLDRLKCTRVVIAHRLSTIRTCNRILVLDGGRIAEDGTYEELMERGGIFRELVERQRA